MQEYTHGQVWDSGDVRITVAPTDHRPVEPTIAFRIEHDGTSVVLAGDTVPCSSLDELARGADALVHTRDPRRSRCADARPADPRHPGLPLVSRTSRGHRRPHGRRHLILTHYVPPLMPGQEDQWRALAATEFDGTVELGNDLLRVSVA